MNKLSILFVKAGLVYLGISTVLGVLVSIGPGYSFMHSHLSMIGGLLFLVFGLCYESIPRFSNKPLFSEKLGILQFWLANAGLIGLSLSYPFMRMYMLKEKDHTDALLAVMVFGLIEAVSIFMFIFNIWKSISDYNGLGTRSVKRT